jgi:hypothetical protein
MYDAVAQAKRDAGDYKIPVVAYHKNHCDWLVIMTAQDWLNLIKETDRPVTVFCKECRGASLQRRGCDDKGKQKYSCNNCGHVFAV